MNKPLALAYVRVSTNRQETTGHSLESQTAILTALAEAEGYAVEIVAEVGSGRTASRPKLTEALMRLNAGKAQALFAVDIDRLARSVKHLADIMEASKRRSWRLVVSSANIDTATPQGELMLGMLAQFAQFESRMIGQRVERQHEARRARGITWGVDQGFKGNLNPQTRVLIAQLSNEGMSLRQIIAQLESKGLSTPRGGRWYAASVKSVLDSPQTKPLLNNPSEAA
jgi:DNA invertase Pin-like site-specific DNA recombinase